MLIESSENIIESSALSTARCVHCDDLIPANIILVNPKTRFCCAGCKTVYELLQANGLSTFYQIKNNGVKGKTPKLFEKSDSWKFLEDPNVLETYLSKIPNGYTIEFFLEGVHCAACIWLIEKLPSLLPEIHSSRLDLSAGVATLILKNPQAAIDAASLLQKFGYRAHPVVADQKNLLLKKENRKLLIKMGVAAAASANIMLISISLYSGVSGSLGKYFTWISFLLYIPVIIYSAIPFYANAYRSILQKSITIDVPVAFALIVGSTASLINLINGSTHVYFDSLSMFIFLLLSSRYVLQQTQKKALHSNYTIQFLTPSTVHRISNTGEVSDTKLQNINPGDLLLVRVGETIPVDGTVTEGFTHLNQSILTGESRLIKASVGDPVYAGCLNEESPIRVRADKTGNDTRIGKILNRVKNSLEMKPKIIDFTDRIAKYFIYSVMLVTIVAFIYYLHTGFQNAFEIALAVIVISCPCAIALACPLTFNISLSKAAKLGLLIKNSESLERLEKIKNIFIDKTGTLTLGEFNVLSVEYFTDTVDIPSLIVSLEKHSSHVIAKRLLSYFSNPIYFPKIQTIDFENVREIIGMGVWGYLNKDQYSIRRTNSLPENKNDQIITSVGLYKNNDLICKINLGDELRNDSKSSIDTLRSRGYNVYILSGDHSQAVQKCAEKLNISGYFAELSPEQKSKIIKKYPYSLMIGDGANDALAFASAHASIAVHGSVEISMQAADAFLLQPGVNSILQLLTIAQETKKTLSRNFIFSIIYNFIGVSAALAGKVHPLFAAVLMPMSAISVFAGAIVGTKPMRNIFSKGAI